MNIKFLTLAIAGAALLSFISLSSAETIAKQIATPLMYAGYDAPAATDNVTMSKRIDRLQIKSVSGSAFLNEHPPL